MKVVSVLAISFAGEIGNDGTGHADNAT